MSKVQFTISQKDIQNLEKAFKEIPLPRDPKALEAKEFQEEFCQHWPMIKTGLGLLSKYVYLIPGFGSIIKILVDLVLTAGEAAHKSMCSES